VNILALDPATNCGWAHSNGQCGVWVLNGHTLVELRSRILLVSETMGIDQIAFEDAAFGSRFVSTKQFHNELRGVIRLTAQSLNVPIVTYMPATIKKFATGNGRADKRQMIRAAETHFGLRNITSDVADARFVLEMAKQGYKPLPSKKAKAKAAKKAVVKQARLFR
jgi:hypothetical protein